MPNRPLSGTHTTFSSSAHLLADTSSAFTLAVVNNIAVSLAVHPTWLNLAHFSMSAPDLERTEHVIMWSGVIVRSDCVYSVTTVLGWIHSKNCTI